MTLELTAGTYCFDCFFMDYTGDELGVDAGNSPIHIYVDLSEEELQALVKMMLRAWDYDCLDHYDLETEYANLLKKHMPSLHDKVYQLAHQQFCQKYPNSEGGEGFGKYEIYVPDEVIEYASIQQSKTQERFKDGNLMYQAYHAEEHLRKGNRIDFTCGNDHHHATVLEVKEGNIIVIRADGWQNTCEERLYC